MVTKGIYLFWDKKYEQVIYAGRFTSRQRIKDHFKPSAYNNQKINQYVQNYPERIESVIFCEFNNISDEDLNSLEEETIKLFKLNKYRYPNSHVFNFTDGGGGVSGFNHSEETIKKISVSLTERCMTKEHCKKISESLIGHEVSMDTRKKISQSLMGHKHSEDTIKQMSETRKGEDNGNYREDIPSPKELLKEYDPSNGITQKVLAEKYNCSQPCIGKRLKKARGD